MIDRTDSVWKDISCQTLDIFTITWMPYFLECTTVTYGMSISSTTVVVQNHTQFHFRWLKGSVNKIVNVESIPFLFNFLNWKPSELIWPLRAYYRYHPISDSGSNISLSTHRLGTSEYTYMISQSLLCLWNEYLALCVFVWNSFFKVFLWLNGISVFVTKMGIFNNALSQW